ncbi:MULTISPECIES: hypothetical protein [Nostocales]|uniref:Uncharacterized protein n=2 Tax=Nostocales TaxID=1161 RepID=A0A8S9T369_9CYAN|nr:hypothetical protein [Tolypothrix bouteillei]KAF3886518.1 hypothetical protein DA73_0400014285 [Tolypothrix bouteillei VB521301]
MNKFLLRDKEGVAIQPTVNNALSSEALEVQSEVIKPTGTSSSVGDRGIIPF